MIRRFCRRYQVDLAQARNSNLDAYPSFNDFFVRPLKEGLRPQPADLNVLSSPADGTCYAMGNLSEQATLSVKGEDFTLNTLLKDPELIQAFHLGTYAIIYLSPADYHRVDTDAARKKLARYGQVFRKVVYASQNMNRYREPAGNLQPNHPHP